MSPYATDYARYALQLLSGSRSRAEQETAGRRWRDISPYLNGTDCLRVLDLANGRLRPQYTLLKASGHQVYGIDLINRSRQGWVDLAYTVARRLYTWQLGLPARTATNKTLIRGDVGILPFPDGSFDLVTSVAAFEHFLDVPAVIADLHRVLRPGGLAWIGIHLFTCPSGGHNLSFAEVPLRSVPRGVEPWDHLRQRRLPFTVPLNEWRRDQYLAAFARHFQILARYSASAEGEHLLTPALEEELSDYDREELTSLAYVVMARKAARSERPPNLPEPAMAALGGP